MYLCLFRKYVVLNLLLYLCLFRPGRHPKISNPKFSLVFSMQILDLPVLELNPIFFPFFFGFPPAKRVFSTKSWKSPEIYPKKKFFPPKMVQLKKTKQKKLRLLSHNGTVAVIKHATWSDIMKWHVDDDSNMIILRPSAFYAFDTLIYLVKCAKPFFAIWIINSAQKAGQQIE